MHICVIYTSPKLGDLILQLPFIKAIANKYNTKVTLCINKHINIKDILSKQEYIDSIIENSFRRGINFFPDIFRFVRNLRKKKFEIAFVLEKTKGPVLACKLAGVKNIFGFGIGSQKYFVNKFTTLIKDDLKYNYTEQSIKFLKKLNINFNFNDQFIVIDRLEKIKFSNNYNHYPKPWICFGVDSTEVNRIWPQEKFAILADKLIEKNLAKTIFIINYENHKDYFKEIKKNSTNQNKLIDCKSLNRLGVIRLIDMCEYFVGIDSGPSCVAGALGKLAFCIIGPTDETLPRFSSMKKIKSDFYNKNREVGIYRCGDNFVQNDSEIKTISVTKVFDTIVKFL